MEVIKIDTLKHRNRNYISLVFKFNNNIQQQIKKLGAKWSSSNKAWIIDKTIENTDNLKLALKDLATFETGPNLKKEIPDPIAIPAESNNELFNSIKKYTELLRSHRYSASTIKTYTEALQSFLKFYGHKNISDITNNDRHCNHRQADN